jgi:23S rRNA pseudouridine1911/1915/1917 synthase
MIVTDASELSGPSPMRRKQGPVRLIDPGEIPGWILFEDERLLVFNKPGDVACHPSKAGPWSSLVGAVREYSGLPKAHLVFRLDRETSGVVVFAKDPGTASRLQVAMQERRVSKSYLAVLTGDLAGAVTVNQPLGDEPGAVVSFKTMVRADGKAAITRFEPLSRSGGFTLARVRTESGRKHQIRAHAQWMGHWMAGDKIYGPDPRLFLEFIETGWTPALQARLLFPRHALHCESIGLNDPAWPEPFRAPFPADLRSLCEAAGLAVPC